MKTIGSMLGEMREEPQTFMQRLDRLRDDVDESEAPDKAALWTLGFAVGLCLRAGWTLNALRAVRALPDEVLDAIELGQRGSGRAP